MLLTYNSVYASLPDGRLLDGIQLPASTYVYDRTGKRLLARFECQNREQVQFDEVPKNIVNAAVAAEDRTFWDQRRRRLSGHPARRLRQLEAGAVVQGASTITQQVIKYAGSIKLAEEACSHRAPRAIGRAGSGGDQQDENPEICQAPRLTFLESDRKLVGQGPGERSWPRS